MKLTPVDSSGSWESIYVYFKTIKVNMHELNHIEVGQNRIINLFSHSPARVIWPEKRNLTAFHISFQINLACISTM